MWLSQYDSGPEVVSVTSHAALSCIRRPKHSLYPGPEVNLKKLQGVDELRAIHVVWSCKDVSLELAREERLRSSVPV